MRKLRHRETESLAQGHIALKWQSAVPESMLLSASRHKTGTVVIVLRQITVSLHRSFNLCGRKKGRHRKDNIIYNTVLPMWQALSWVSHMHDLSVSISMGWYRRWFQVIGKMISDAWVRQRSIVSCNEKAISSLSLWLLITSGTFSLVQVLKDFLTSTYFFLLQKESRPGLPLWKKVFFVFNAP